MKKTLNEYYKSDCGKLIIKSLTYDKLLICNDYKLIDRRISKEYFDTLNTTRIKSTHFDKLVNEYYSTVKETWIFEHSPYKNLDNFESISDDRFESMSCIKRSYKCRDTYLVYNRGMVYEAYLCYAGSGNNKFMLIRKGNCIRRTNVKNCAPIMNVNTKKII